MAEEFTRCSAGIIGLFFVVFCQIAGLQRRSMVKLSRLSWSTRLKRRSQQTPYTARFCSKLSSVRSPSLEACNFPMFLSRHFHGPTYFYFEFISNSDPRNTSIRIFLNPQLATFSFRMRLPSTRIRPIRKRIRLFLSFPAWKKTILTESDNVWTGESGYFRIR